MRGERRGIRRSSDPRDRQAYLIAGLRRITGIEPVVPPTAVSAARGRPRAADTGFGNRLRLERERRRISLASIATNTKIGLTLLQGLERDDVSRWPSGIFRRSFIRAYAEAIGLDADAISREFLDRFQVWRRQELRVRVEPGIAVEDSGDAVLRLTLADPSPGGAQAAGVGGEERDAPLLEMAIALARRGRLALEPFGRSTFVSPPLRAGASCKASAFSSVASIPA